jgi:hypothetical protein
MSRADLTGLVDLWRVSGVAAEDVDTWLRLDETEFQLWRDCGVITGGWRASADLFLATVVGATGECFPVGTIPTAPWLESVTGQHATDEGWVLTGADGTTIATLTIDGAPDPHLDAARSFAVPPPAMVPGFTEPDGGAEPGRFHGPAALPADARPAAAADLTGRWVPAGLVAPTAPYVLFDPDGSWSGSDGCNGNQGRWAVNGRGDFLATSGMSTMMFCEGAPVPHWVARARLAGIDAGRLRLLAGDGTALGELERD